MTAPLSGVADFLDVVNLNGRRTVISTYQRKSTDFTALAAVAFFDTSCGISPHSGM